MTFLREVIITNSDGTRSVGISETGGLQIDASGLNVTVNDVGIVDASGVQVNPATEDSMTLLLSKFDTLANKLISPDIDGGYPETTFDETIVDGGGV